MKLYCIKCKYKFERPSSPQRCPYCGNDNSVKQKESAQDILNAVNQEMDMIAQSRKERDL